MKNLKELKEKNPLLFVNIIFLTIAIPFYLYLCIFKTSSILISDDFYHHYSRVEGIYEGLKTGQFPVYIYPYTMSGISSACPTFYPDLLLFPFALLRFINIPAQTILYIHSFACMWITLNVFYKLASKILKTQKQINLATLLFMFSSYFLADHFKRFAVGEYTAFIFVLVLGLAISTSLW